ncbi:MAG: tRNA (adenosine(37)-N6)-threonylcarbamoyltransferase complex transferase subunit TsaD [Clostridia bacterium]|nr:tRNA (adenosine(37)-N6)-threonylcarbamoyltransferase complex transferase subunit TsaD [Clostridia bacterium]
MSDYYERSLKKQTALREREDFVILAIESSCDETAVSVLFGRDVKSNVISSQIEIHKRFGGVVPEIASRNHVLAIDNLIDEAVNGAGITLKDVDVIAVTYGAGLLGALLVGVSYAKALAYALDVPLMAIDHIKGHVFANFIENKDLKLPFLSLLASGGHTEIVEVNGYEDVRILGQTADDAAGEAFDKVARVLGLPYPGGPQIEACAKEGSPVIPMPTPFKGEKHLNFSYSGLKTAVINYVHNNEAKGVEINRSDVACSFQKAAVDQLVKNAIEAAKQTGYKSIALAGGVGANTCLRETLTREAKKHGVTVYLPSKKLCTDNAAMIGMACYFAVKEGVLPADLDLDADPNL